MYIAINTPNSGDYGEPCLLLCGFKFIVDAYYSLCWALFYPFFLPR